MRSSEPKSKRAKKNVDEPAVQTTAPVLATDEAPKSKRKAPAKKAAGETSLTQKHRGSAKKAAERKAAPEEIVTVEPAAAEPAVPVTVSSTAEAEPVAAAEPAPVSHEEIAALAYSLWVERGYEHGSHEQDWLRAERMLTSGSSKVAGTGV